MWGTFSSKRFPFHKVEAFEGSQWGHPVTDDEAAYEAVTVSNKCLTTYFALSIMFKSLYSI